MTDKEQNDMFNEVFTRMRENEKLTSNLCIRIDNVIDQMKTSTDVTDKFLEALDKRRISDEAREAKFWKTIAILGGSLVVLALGEKPAKMLAEHFFGPQTSIVSQAALPLQNDRRYITYETRSRHNI